MNFIFSLALAIQVAWAVDVPTLFISTENAAPIDSKDVYIPTQLNFGGEVFFNAQIRGRGNSTWTMPKKPYRLKLKQKAALLGMSKSKDWILLANYSDKTLMRTELGLGLGRQLGIPFTVDSRYVEVNLNGKEQGTYMLTENVDAKSPFLFELDARRDGDFVFVSTRKVPYVLKKPSNPDAATWEHFQNWVQRAEDALYGENFADPHQGYAKHINVESFIDYYIVNEIFKNQDAANFSSIYFHEGQDGKIHMGPLWDFDLALGNVNYSPAQFPEGWWLRDLSPWFTRLFQDPIFEARVKARWREVRPTHIASLFPRMDQWAQDLQQTQIKNFTVWDILNTYVWPNPVVTGSYEGEVNYIKTWLTARLNWLDTQYMSAP